MDIFKYKLDFSAGEIDVDGYLVGRPVLRTEEEIKEAKNEFSKGLEEAFGTKEELQNAWANIYNHHMAINEEK